MCGPIALAVSAGGSPKFWWGKFLYNLGRTLTYGFLGLLIGFVGMGFKMAGIQQWMSIILGAMIVLMALFYQQSERALVGKGLGKALSKLKKSLGKWLQRGGGPAFLMTGLVNGLLPCGMVYIALLAALALSEPIHSMLYMFSFGLGTVPMLLVLMFAGQLVSLNWRKRLFGAMPYFAVLIGILFIVRGMGLGGYFLSPELQLFDFGAPATEMTICR